MHLPQILMVIWALLLLSQSKCIHDHVSKNATMVYINDTQLHHQRLLQSLGFGPIRIHFQYNTTLVNESDPIGKNLMKIMNIIHQFWAKTIQIDYLPALSFKIADGYDSSNYKCMTYTVPKSLIDTPIPNKDFGLLISADDDGDSGVTAYSFPCASSQTTKRTLWGFMHWNKKYLAFDPLSFQQNIYIGLHQTIHILGFSQVLYPNFKNSQIFVSSGGNMYLNGPYLQKQITRQYGCTTSLGMSLQINGGDGTALSHWARKTASNQLMTAGVSINNPTVSYLTLALLEQTGWYRRIYKNLGNFINFGYKKGCSMLDSNNCGSNEYCTVINEKKPDYDRTALGYCKNDSLSNCLYVKYYVNFICTDPNYAQKSLNADQGIVNMTGETGGQKSRCFESDLILSGQQPSKYPFRCYQAVCSPTGRTLTVKVGKSLVFCMFPNQVVKVKGYDGTLRCPDNFESVCKVQRCTNECNGNGMCLGGRCLCDPSFQGPACSQLSLLGSIGYASKTNLLLTTTQNKNCVVGSYLTQFGDCEQCQLGCLQCDDTGCVVCANDKLPLNGKCY